MKRFAFIKILLTALAFAGFSAHAATIQIVVDNDFALLTGTSTTVERLVYQNNVVWNQQITNASSFSLSLSDGEDSIYILAMGGGGQENLSGRVNGVDISTLSSMRSSSNLRSFLSGYNNPAVADGSYSVSLIDVQTALPNLTWSTSTPPTGGGAVISLSGFALGYPFADSTAVLYRFSSSEVGVASVPEPSSLSLLVVGLGGWIALRRRKQT